MFFDYIWFSSIFFGYFVPIAPLDRVHKPRECPAYGKTCRACSKSNHFASVCRTKEITTVTTNRINSDYDNREFIIGNVEKEECEKVTQWMEKISLYRKNITFKIDTGAEVNIIPLNVLNELGENIELQKTTVTLRGFGGSKTKAIGMCTIECAYNNIQSPIEFIVVDLDTVPILGLTGQFFFSVPRSYNIRSGTRLYRRNSRHIRKFKGDNIDIRNDKEQNKNNDKHTRSGRNY